MGFLNNVQFFSSNERMQQIKQAHLQQQNQQAAEEKQNNRSSILYNETVKPTVINDRLIENYMVAYNQENKIFD